MNKIHQFINHIYPRMLYVVVTDSATLLNQNFENRENPDNEISQSDFDNNKAITFRCTHRSSLDLGVCVAFRKKEYMQVKEMAHEALHVSSSIHNDLGIAMGFGIGEDETAAYIVGWAADCINQVKTGKFK